jgi:hypothetical protein
MTTYVLNLYQVQWALSLFQFQFIITYHLGQHQGKPYALSRRSYLTLEEGDVIYDQQFDTILKLENLRL